MCAVSAARSVARSARRSASSPPPASRGAAFAVRLAGHAIFHRSVMRSASCAVVAARLVLRVTYFVNGFVTFLAARCCSALACPVDCCTGDCGRAILFSARCPPASRCVAAPLVLVPRRDVLAFRVSCGDPLPPCACSTDSSLLLVPSRHCVWSAHFAFGTGSAVCGVTDPETRETVLFHRWRAKILILTGSSRNSYAVLCKFTRIWGLRGG